MISVVVEDEDSIGSVTFSFDTRSAEQLAGVRALLHTATTLVKEPRSRLRDELAAHDAYFAVLEAAERSREEEHA